MPWTELTNQRTRSSRHYQDDADPRRRACSATITPLHYESVLDSGVYDLPIMSAIVSSLLNKPVSSDTVVLGEVGLSGEVRGISMIDRRLSEAAKLGFKRAIIPESNCSQVTSNSTKPIGVKNINSALEHLFD